MCFSWCSTQSKAYKLYNPNFKKIIISPDVVFDEENIWEWSDNDNQQIAADFDEENEDEKQQPPAEFRYQLQKKVRGLNA